MKIAVQQKKHFLKFANKREKFLGKSLHRYTVGSSF